MLISNIDIQIKGVESDILNKGGQPHLSIVIEKGLDSIGFAKVSLSSSTIEALLGKSKTFKHPPEIRIQASLVDSKDQSKKNVVPFFRGFLSKSFISYNPSMQIDLLFLDPLVTSFESDQIEMFHNISFKDIADKILGNAFREGCGSLNTQFIGEVPFVESAANDKLDDFTFIKDLAKTYGLKFFYNQEEKNHVVTFLAPEFNKEPSIKLDHTFIDPGFTLETSFSTFYDAVIAINDEGQEHEILASGLQEAGTISSRLAVRKETAIELVCQLHLSNAKQVQTLQSIARAKLLNSMMENQVLRFSTSYYLPLGKTIKIDFKQSRQGDISDMSGNYLVTNMKSRFDQSQMAWIHFYTVARP